MGGRKGPQGAHLPPAAFFVQLRSGWECFEPKMCLRRRWHSRLTSGGRGGGRGGTSTAPWTVHLGEPLVGAAGRACLECCPWMHVAGESSRPTLSTGVQDAVPRAGGRLTLPPHPPSLQRPRGERGARGVPVQGAAGPVVVCAAAAAQAPLGRHVPGAPWRHRSVCGLGVQVGGAGPVGGRT